MLKKNTEEKIIDIEFNIHKFNNIIRPNPENTIIISCFSEFGCEIIGCLYCLPRIKAQYPGKYLIAMGWYGRAYLYKHLVDEFWETKEDCQHLRDYTFAFHHKSKNLKKLEKSLGSYGKVLTSDAFGRIAVGNTCNVCKHFWGGLDSNVCPKCSKTDVTKALFSDVANYKRQITPIPPPSLAKLEEAKKYLGINPVGVTARHRSTYGRNLQPEFYVKLVEMLQNRGYTPIWLGEKQTTLECPVPGIVDMTRKEEARDLELTLAIVSQLKFTVQFWTASSRLAAIMGIPYLIFESPDQIYGQGQEAFRLSLSTTGKAKIALCHYLNVFNDHPAAIKLADRCIQDMENNDFRLILGMIDQRIVVEDMIKKNRHRLVL